MSIQHWYIDAAVGAGMDFLFHDRSFGGTPQQAMFLDGNAKTLTIGCPIVFASGYGVKQDCYMPAAKLTIASGVITITQSTHTVETQASAGTDDLDTINGGVAEQVLWLRPYSGTHDVVIKHGTGNIYCPEGLDITLSELTDYAMLVYANSIWSVVAYNTLASSGGMASTASTHGGAGNSGKLLKLDANGKADGINLTSNTSSSGTAAVTGTSDTASCAIMATENNLAPPTAGVAIHAQIIDNVASPIVGGFTQPERPRNLVYTFGAAWGGGNPVITGTDQDDQVCTETPVVNLGSTRTGVVIFKTVTSIAFAAGAGGGTHSLDIATGNKLGILAPYAVAVGIATVDGVLDLATFTSTAHQRGFTPVSAPNAAKNYAVTVPSTAVTHTHGPGTFAGPAHVHALN